MKSFIKDALSENGTASAKRIAFFILLFAFLVECSINMIWAKILDSTLRDQLYYAMLTTLGSIIGVTLINSYKEVKIAQSNNNATVGASSPPEPDATK